MKFFLEQNKAKYGIYYNYKANFRVNGKVKSVRVYLGNEQQAKKILDDFVRQDTDQKWLYSYSGEVLLLEIVKKLQFNKIINTVVQRETEWDCGNYITNLIIERCLYPGSKWELAQRIFNKSFFKINSDIPSDAFSESNIYHYMDYINPYIHSIQAELIEQIYNIFPPEDEVLLLDGTSLSTYGEDSLPSSTNDEIEDEDVIEVETKEISESLTYNKEEPLKNQSPKKRISGKPVARYNGYSRNKRPDLAQVNVILGVNQRYIPLFFDVFAGNATDLSMFASTIKSLQTTYPKLLQRLKSKFIIFDRGNVAEDILNELDDLQKQRDVYFITGVKSVLFKKELAQLDEDTLPILYKNKNSILKGSTSIKTVYKKSRLTLFYVSPSVRRHKLTEFEKRFSEVHADLKNIEAETSSSDQKKVDKMHELLKKQKMVQLIHLRKYDKDGNPKISKILGQDLYRLNKKNIEEKKGIFGKFVLISNKDSLTAEQMMQYYLSKNTVEQEFHLLKDVLEEEPFFHRLPHRIETHVALVSWGMVLLSVLNNILRQHEFNYSFEELHFIIKQGYLQEAIYSYPNFKTYKVTTSTNFSDKLHQIFSIFDKKAPEFKISEVL
jgi:transposase